MTTKQKKMDFDLLRTFIAVVDNGSFTRAAGQIYRSQSAISMQMKRLEGQLDHALFYRSPKELSLTANGKALIPYARRLLNLHDEAMNTLKGGSRLNVIRIGCPDDYVRHLVPVLINIFRKSLPGVSTSVVSASSAELRQKMDKGELDVAILTRIPNTNEGELIYQDHGVWVCSNEQLLNTRPIPLALFDPSCKFNSTVIDGLEKREIPYDLVCQTSNSSVLIELARSGVALTVLAKNTVPNDLLAIAHNDKLPTLPVVEIVVCLSGANQRIENLSLRSIAQQLAELVNTK
ncbi:MAG: LysR family transcriptional regulator [Colwellia sp.]|nr:LysR family transcriptional regulator [Colwellia sp.]